MAKLYLIPTSLNPQINAPALLPNELSQVNHLRHFIVETAKIGRAHIKQLQLATPLQQLNIQELNKHKQDLSALIKPIQDGFDCGLLSDCGCPAVADPGSRIVAVAHELGIEVIPLVGPSSIILSLMASGLNGQNFVFHGYLPTGVEERKAKLKRMEQQSLKEGTSHIFIEAPFRNQKLFETLINSLNPEIRLALGIDLMTQSQQIISKRVSQWQTRGLQLNKQEVIFLFGRN